MRSHALRRLLAAVALVLVAGLVWVGQSGLGAVGQSGFPSVGRAELAKAGQFRLGGAGQADDRVRFVVTLDPALPAQPAGRLLVVMVPVGRRAVEPRLLIGAAGRRAVPAATAGPASLRPR